MTFLEFCDAHMSWIGVLTGLAMILIAITIWDWNSR